MATILETSKRAASAMTQSGGRGTYSLSRSFRLCVPLYKLIATQYLFSIVGPIFAFAFPLLFLLMMGFILPSQRGSIISGVTSLSIMSLSIFAMPSAIADFKTSVLLKRIGATPIRPWMFIFVVITFYMAMTTLTTGWILAWTAILWPTEAPARFAQIEWGSFFFTFVLTLLMASNIGMFIASVAKTSNGVQTIGMFVSMSSNFLGGQFIPLSLISQNRVLDILSHIVPFRYTVALFNQTYSGDSIFTGFGTDYYSASSAALGVPLFHDYDRWLNLFLPVAVIVLCFLFSSRRFKWSNR